LLVVGWPRTFSGKVTRRAASREDGGSVARRPRTGFLVGSIRLPRCRACGGGRVGFTTELRGRPGGRSRRAGTPFLDETVPAGCQASCCGPAPTPRFPPRTVHDRRDRDMGCTPAAHAPFLPIMAAVRTRHPWADRPLKVRVRAHSGQAQRHHRQSRGTPPQRTRPKRACAKPGTAAHATTIFGGEPDPAPSRTRALNGERVTPRGLGPDRRRERRANRNIPRSTEHQGCWIFPRSPWCPVDHERSLSARRPPAADTTGNAARRAGPGERVWPPH
jgi:hypothetical protein